ncbi:MAG: P27 family phage terminase small subunit [Raoultibacter sp.]
MGRTRKPTRLLIAEGKTHLSNSDVKRRLEEELEVDLTDITPPPQITGKLAQEFMAIAAKLAHVDAKLFTELDVDELARYLTAKDNYWTITKLLDKALGNATKRNSAVLDTDEIAKLTRAQNTFFTQCETTARALGLTVTSRCAIVLPKGAEEPKQNKFEKFNKK